MLGVLPFMGAGINFKWSIAVPDSNNLLKVSWEKRLY